MYRELARRYVQDLYRRWGRPQDVRRFASAKTRAVAAPAAAGPVAASPAAAPLTTLQ
jgi:hypothetical protein